MWRKSGEMKTINKTSSPTLFSTGLKYHHINDLRRELLVIQKIMEQIPYTENNEFTFTLNDFLGKHFQGLGIIDFRDKVLSIVHRLEGLEICKRVWVGKLRGLGTLISFKPGIERLELYQKNLIKEINHRESFLTAPVASPILFSKYHVDIPRKLVTWNGLTKKWESNHKKEVQPNPLILCEYILSKHLNWPERAEKEYVDMRTVFIHIYGNRTFNLKQLQNTYNYLRDKLQSMFMGHNPTPKQVLRWRSSKICISVPS